MVSRAIMRRPLYVWRLRQLLGGDAGQSAENLFSLLDGKGHPYPPRIQLPAYLAAARGWTTAVRD